MDPHNLIKAIGHMKIGGQLRDIFIKALNGVEVNYICIKLGMINIYGPTWRGALRNVNLNLVSLLCLVYYVYICLCNINKMSILFNFDYMDKIQTWSENSGCTQHRPMNLIDKYIDAKKKVHFRLCTGYNLEVTIKR